MISQMLFSNFGTYAKVLIPHNSSFSHCSNKHAFSRIEGNFVVVALSENSFLTVYFKELEN